MTRLAIAACLALCACQPAPQPKSNALRASSVTPADYTTAYLEACSRSPVAIHTYPGAWPHELSPRLTAWWRVAGVASVWYDPAGLDQRPLFRAIEAAGVPWSLCVGVTDSSDAALLPVIVKVRQACSLARMAGLDWPVLVIVDWEPASRNALLSTGGQFGLAAVLTRYTTRAVDGGTISTPQAWYYTGRQPGVLGRESEWTGPPCWVGMRPGPECYWPTMTAAWLRAFSGSSVPFISLGAHYELADAAWPTGDALPLVWSLDGSRVNVRWSFEAGRAAVGKLDLVIHPNPWDTRGVQLWDHALWFLAGAGCGPADKRSPTGSNP